MTADTSPKKSLHLVFKLHPGYGPMHASFYLAKALQAAGHRVTYLATDPYRHAVEEQGFDFYPDNWEKSGSEVVQKPLYKHLFGNLRRIRNYYRPLLDFIPQFIARVEPDFIFLDADQLPYAIALYRYNIPSAFVNTTFNLNKSPGCPPANASYIPGGSRWSGLLTELLWWRLYYRKSRVRLNVFFISLGCFDYSLRRLARWCHFPLSQYANHRRTYSFGLTHLPEIILFPKELELGCARAGNCLYTGPQIDLHRQDIPFDWGRVDCREGVVLCALGSEAAGYYREYMDFLKKIIVLFSEYRHLTLILAAGSADATGALGDLPANVYVFPKVPQLEILQKARFMISHGGANSVKEAILAGVPLICYPLNDWVDQNGVAARVVYHGLGRRGDVRKDSLAKIKGDFEEIIHNPLYRQRVARMRDVFLSYYRTKEDVVAIQDLIRSLVDAKPLQKQA